MKEEKNWQDRICPYLGQRSDPGTALSYPSPLNSCTHAIPIAHIDLTHQKGFCLTSGYSDCREFMAEPGAPLPEGLYGASRGFSYKRQGSGKWLWIILLLGLGICIVWLSVSQGGGFGLLFVKPTATTAISTGTHLATTLTEPSLMPTLIPTLTPTLEGTPTSRPLLGLETPLGVDHKFVIHQIQEGDSLSRIASNHGTTVEAMVAINYRLPSPLVPGWMIVVPLNFVDVQGFPPFEVYHVTEAISLDDMVVQVSADPAQFKYYNALDDDFVPQAGDYFLIPRSISLTPTP
jgi:hypothetical protein